LYILNNKECFYQWDLNMKLTCDDFKVGDTIHFITVEHSEPLGMLTYQLDDKVVVDVPNILLQSAYPITAFRYICEGECVQTVDEATFKVVARCKPSDYIYEETEVLNWKELDLRVQDLQETKVDKGVSYINRDIRIIYDGLTHVIGALEVKQIGDILWVIDNGYYYPTPTFETSNEKLVFEFDLPKSISNKICDQYGRYGDTGFIDHVPALASGYKPTRINCYATLTRSNIGDEVDTYQVTYVGLSSLVKEDLVSILVGFSVKIPILLV
jgi:hypothetical protein